MKRLAIALALGTAAVAVSPTASAEVQLTTNLPIVELSITETVKGDPDLATVSAGVSSRAPTAVEAMRVNAREMKSVIDRIKALGVAEKDIQTTEQHLSNAPDDTEALVKGRNLQEKLTTITNSLGVDVFVGSYRCRRSQFLANFAGLRQ